MEGRIKAEVIIEGKNGKTKETLENGIKGKVSNEFSNRKKEKMGSKSLLLIRQIKLPNLPEKCRNSE